MSVLPKLDEECFFIAPIGKEGSEERHRSDGVLEYIIVEAASEVGLQAVRADQLAEPGQITLQVIEHILGARAAVADLTYRNPNVFYELAVRHTARLPTVLIAEEGEQLPFDIAQMRTIFFSHTDLRSAARCRTEIVRQLREALGGAVDSPIAASVDLQRLQAGNTVERNVAELVTGIADLTKAVAEIRRELDARMELNAYLTGDFLILFNSLREVSRQLRLSARGSPEEVDRLLSQLTRVVQQMHRYLAGHPAASKSLRSEYLVELAPATSQEVHDEVPVTDQQ